MQLTSDAFADGERIPAKYTCDGDNITPPLAWTEVPPEAMSLALVVEDPDAPTGTFDHWVLWNIPTSVTSLDEDLIPLEDILPTVGQGANSDSQIRYKGPCPPPGDKSHRYIFRLYALDAHLNLEAGATKPDLLSEMDGHVLAEAVLVGMYDRE